MVMPKKLPALEALARIYESEARLEEAARIIERIVTLNRVGEVPSLSAAYHMPAASHADWAPMSILAAVPGVEIDQIMPHCVLSHIDVQAEVEETHPGSTALWFQSIAGSDAANASNKLDTS